MIDVTIWPLVAAAAAHMTIGAVWYHPNVFGTKWMQLNHLTPEMIEKGTRRRPLYLLLSFIAGLVAAYVMNYFGIAWSVFDIVGAFELAIWCWLGFVAPAMFGQVIGEQKPFRLYLINALYWLVSFIVMAIILVL